jgi:hypothetical protein
VRTRGRLPSGPLGLVGGAVCRPQEGERSGRSLQGVETDLLALQCEAEALRQALGDQVLTLSVGTTICLAVCC